MLYLQGMHIPLPVTSLYAALAALFYLALSIAVIRLRWKERVPILDGGKNNLTRAIRVHGNFAEYVPFALFMLALLEISGRIPAPVLHGLGIALLAGRVAHLYSARVYELKHGTFYVRATAMTLTFGVYVLCALMLFYIAL